MKRGRTFSSTSYSSKFKAPRRSTYGMSASAMAIGRRRASMRAFRAGYGTVARTRGVYGQGEMKYFDSFLSATAIAEGTAWTGTELDPATLLTLFVPIEGSAINQRIGRKVTVKKIKIKGLITTAASPDNVDMLNAPCIRLLLVQDMQTNAAQMQGEEVMATPGGATTALTSLTFQNLANFGRFKVLKDKMLRPSVITAGTDGANTTSQITGQIPFKWNINYPAGCEVQFNAANGGTIADIVNNSWHIIGTKSNANFDTNIHYQCRVCYKDK